jgi:uncharacterized protein (DUF58 family)
VRGTSQQRPILSRSEPLLGAASFPAHFSLLHLARSLSTSLHHGRHRSLARGGSAEFYDFRSYSAGDPLRLVDWRLFGRSDRLYLRRYQQESQISLVLVVDASESMRFAGLEMQGGSPRGMTKLRRACELAAALAYLAAKEGDRVGLVIAGDAQPPIEPRSGWPAMHQTTRALESLLKPLPLTKRRRHLPRRDPSPASKNTLADGLLAAEALTRRSGVIVALSDALDESAPVLAAASRLRFAGGGSFSSAQGGRRDVALVQILSDDEIGFSSHGAARLIDHESGLEVEADLDEIAASYRAAIGEHIATLRRGLIAGGGRHVLAPLSRGAIDVLRELVGR